MTEPDQQSASEFYIDERSNPYFRALFEHPDLGVLLTDALGHIVRANTAFCALLGRDAARLRGECFTEYCLANSLPIGKIQGGLHALLDAQGVFVNCLITVAPLNDSNARLIGYIVLVQPESLDELSQRQAAQIRELELLLNSLPMPVAFKDRQFIYRYANRACCHLLGLNAEQVLGHSDSQILPTDTARLMADLDRQAVLQQHELVTEDTAFTDHHGDTRYFSIYKLPIHDLHGQLLGLLDVALDVTERKLEESERLTVLQSQRDALVQEVHHRIKNHLQGVVGLLHRSIASNPALAQPLQSVLGQIESIAGIHGLQSRLNQQRLTFGQIASMIAELYPQQKLSIDGNGLSVELPQQEAVPFALILNELLSNAFKHSRESINVAIAIERQAEHLQISVCNSPACLPDEFDFSGGVGLGTGLRLLRSLLPHEGAVLSYRQQNDSVYAKLSLMLSLFID